jgi:hypothetical protein
MAAAAVSAEARSHGGEAQQGNELRPMKNNDHQEAHEGQHLQETVDMLFDRSDFPRCTRIAQIPERGHFMKKEEYNHDQNDEGVDLQKRRGENRYAHFDKLEQMKYRFFHPAR